MPNYERVETLSGADEIYSVPRYMAQVLDISRI